MLPDKFNKLKEEAYIGQEMLDRSILSEVERKCVTVRQTVKDGDFSLGEALSIYGVSQSDYDSFVANELIEQVRQAIFELGSVRDRTKIEVVATIEIVGKIYQGVLKEYDKNASIVLDHLDTLSKDINEGKIAV